MPAWLALSITVHFDDRFRKSLRRFLRQIVTDAASGDEERQCRVTW